ncbi:WGR domain-containing protein [Microvirga arabica]|nr:WGR domain-containing protein [Microvirga arabica]
MIERDLFETVRLVRNWRQIGTPGQELVETFESEETPGQALQALAGTKRRRRCWYLRRALHTLYAEHARNKYDHIANAGIAISCVLCAVDDG